MDRWYYKKGDEGDVVLSTRIRLARNLEEYPFPSRLDAEGKKKVNEIIKNAVFESGNTELGYIEMSDLTHIQAVSLAERHVISPEFAGRVEGAALLLSEDESMSIMLCEEDHIKIQVVESGLAFEKAYARCDAIDSMLDEKLHYAFNEKIGYLTSRPSDVGTAMRASVLLHLPALTALGQIPGIAGTVSKLGISITGAYGSRAHSAGDIYQVSNQITLGITEETAITNLKSIVLQIVHQERNAAEKAVASPTEEDRIYRALGVLQNARMLGTQEFMALISKVRMGAVRGVLDIPAEKLNALIIDMQPATISVLRPGADTPGARDVERAKAIRDALS